MYKLAKFSGFINILKKFQINLQFQNERNSTFLSSLPKLASS